jgi:histidyl-tRNA synthetase
VAAAPPAVVVPVGGLPPADALALGEELRGAGVACEVELGGRTLRKALERAGKLGARWAVLVGEAEAARGVATVKDLAAGEQHEVPRGALAVWLATRVEATQGSAERER